MIGVWDHPRVCGEKHAVPVSAIWSAGSPPRMRGKAASPAHDLMGWQDHPRVCGEKGSAVRVIYGELGSPPRMRGKEAGSIQR